MWNTFCTGPALTDIASSGKYRDGSSQSLSSWAGSEGDQGGVTSPSEELNKAGLDGILAYLTQVSTNLGSSQGAKNFGGDALGKVHNFTGEAYGSRLRAWIGDDLMIKVGDKYTYNDVTRDVSIGTGGYGWKEEHGDTDDHDWHWGKATSYSRHVGDAMSTSYREGTWGSHSYTYGAYTDWSLQFDAHATLSITGSIHTENTVDLGIYNSNSLFIGLKASMDIHLIANESLDITLGHVGKIEIAPQASEMEIIASKWKLEIQTDEVKLRKSHTALNNTITELLGQKSTLNDTDNKLLGIQNSLTATDNAVADNKATLTQNIAALSDSVQSVSSSHTKAMATLTAAVNTNTAALHSSQ